MGNMDLTRREILRRLGGVGALAALAATSKFVSGSDAASTSSTHPATAAAGRAGGPGNGSRGSRTFGVEGRDGRRHRRRPDDPRVVHTRPDGTTIPIEEDTSTTAGGSTGDPGSTTTTESGGMTMGDVTLSGTIGPLTIGAGSVATIVGDVNLAGDIMVMGVLNGVDSFTLEGNGHQIMAHMGGRIELVGRAKTGWARVGDSVSGWSTGDRVAVAPMAPGDYMPRETTWGGSWGSVGAPGPITLMDGRTMHAEVANLDRSITIRNVRRIMMMEGAGACTFKYLSVQDSGDDPLGFYPIHFHLNGGSVRGSVVEGVVVEDGRNRAFVPHGSDGIRFYDCVAYRTTKKPFWWDEGDGNDSADVTYDKCLAMVVFRGPAGEERNRLTGFQLGEARGSRCINSAAVAIQGQDDSGGFWWPGSGSLEPWEFRNNVAHNNVGHGFIVWQNTDNPHVIEDCVAFRNERAGIDHGAYRNGYFYRDLVLQENLSPTSINVHANAKADGQTYSNIRTDGGLILKQHNLPPQGSHRHVNVGYTHVVFDERGVEPSYQEFIDCGLTTDDFDLSGIHPNSTILIQEGGNTVAQWANGSWS